MVTVKAEGWPDCVDEVQALAEQHTHEINKTRSDRKLQYKPNMTLFNMLYELDLLHVICVRDAFAVVFYCCFY